MSGFLSTLSLRRATIEFDSRHSDQNISIHALLAESDGVCRFSRIPQPLFLSTLSLRRATAKVGSDFNDLNDFYPRSPCGERRRKTMMDCKTSKFLSTLSLRRATGIKPKRGNESRISIHALLAESDAHCFMSSKINTNFYPRSPCGERHFPPLLLRSIHEISIHALLAESDQNLNCTGNIRFLISIHALLAESDTFWLWAGSLLPAFLSTLSLRRATKAVYASVRP